MALDLVGVGFHLVNVIMGATCIFMSNSIYRYFSKTSLGAPLKIIGAAFGWFLFFEMLNVFRDAGVIEQLDRQFPGFAMLVPISELLFVSVLLYGVYALRNSFHKFDWLKEIEKL